MYGCLAQFIRYFVNYDLSFDQSRDMILQYCAQYEIDKTRTHILLSELETLQKQNYKLTKKDQLHIYS